jgi:hypothetical protein
MEKQKQESRPSLRSPESELGRQLSIPRLKELPEDEGFNRFVDFFGRYRLSVGADLSNALQLCGILEWIFNNGYGDKFLEDVEKSVQSVTGSDLFKNGRF